MRARIDISEIEAQTKIRAKYLRALENEEWDLLPGPTYVKSFLRTYAEALHLDARRLVEEYKLQYERLSDVELQPIVPPGQRDRRQKSRGLGRLWFAAAAILVLVGALYFLGRGGGDDDDGDGSTPAATTTTTTTPATEDEPRRERRRGDGDRDREREREKPEPKLVRLQVRPTAPVYVCLEAAGDRTLINGQVLEAGANSDTFRSSRFRIGLGNGSVVLRIDGKRFNVPESSNPIGYEITPKRRRSLPENRRPTCAA